MATVVIAGGGISGVAAALAVARNGHRATVLERNPEFGELGAGIQLGPNAFRALDHLGVADRVRSGAVFIDEINLMDGMTGDRITSLPLGAEFSERYRYPYAVVHRVDLHAALLDACGQSPLIDLRTDCAVAGYTVDGATVSVRLPSGEVVTGDALIGADGIRSAVRRQLVGDGEPRVSGHTIYRSVVPIEQVAHELRWNSVTLWAGPKMHVVHYPIAGGRFFNLAATVDDGATQIVTGKPAARDLVMDTFAALAPETRRFLDQGQDWRTWVLCDRDPVPRWTDRQVVLIGDAAHPMLQYAAQGACMALEDVVCLDGLLSQGETDFVELFAAFAAARTGRTAWIQGVSRAIGEEVYHPSASAADERTRWLSSLSAAQVHELVDPLYLGPVTADIA
ncbi:FAD-dependent monooxygenase [Actinokineospora xionganensis]|uniref:FAD-dependent monooxygenase n=1 Tax=Actinokineospora xionganensis TaxID=2684470 RepID=A0ABR7KZX4_9PSEU|nr:FAD-dependent monooxygenase [Actinokineospora xionganensis]MBC6445982.1 FAD-dependent monooxygenase [Actinokineospora xionganensis]